VSLLETVYNAAVHILRPLLPAFDAASPKFSAAVRGRRVAASRISEWAACERDPTRPLLWLHGASAGELAGAAPVVDEVRRARPDLQLLVTYSSPSAEDVLPDLSPDHAGYPPLEMQSDCREAVRAARPDALVFAKLDAWPGLTRAAAEASVPLGMINATVRPSSARLRGPGRQLMVPSYGRLEAVGAVSEEESDRLERLGTRRGAIHITGDASFERSLARLDRAREATSGSDRLLPLLPPGAIRLMAGSTWPEDERVLIEGLASWRASVDESPRSALQLVLVPHEPDAAAVARIRELCERVLGHGPTLWSRLGDAPPVSGVGGAEDSQRPLVIDSVGFLAELYLETDIAWVGGGVGGEGLHSVVEPAAAGIPVLFGPVQDRWEAGGLIESGGALEVPVSGLADVLGPLLADPALRARMGTAARAYVESGRGAASAGARLVLELIDRGRASAPARTRTSTR
jgi:3-deoxy-D-manno-octulosonic-acid transferase